MTQNLSAISTLSEGTSVADLPVLVVEKKTATAKNGKAYADLVVRDKSGTLKCKIWNFNDCLDITGAGKVIKISVAISSYNGELQGIIDSFQACDLGAENFAKSTRFKTDEMYSDILEFIDEFTEPMTQSVARWIIMSTGKDFLSSPAATGVHNAWLGGLLEHTWGMLQLAKPIVEHYKNMYGAKLSIDKVYFGVICHDAFKTEEYDLGNLAFPKTPDGILVNHIVVGPARIYEACNKWWDSNIVDAAGTSGMPWNDFARERAHLMHLVASHHGQLDWGSPVVPSTLEAVLLHQLDMIDSRFMHALELVEGKEGPIKGFSEKSWTQRTQFMK